MKRAVAGRSVIFCCDIQERFRPLIHQYPAVIHTANKLMSAAKILNVPIVATEQYPKGLGRTVAELKIDERAAHVESKTRFSMLTPSIKGFLDRSQTSSVILFGIESHVCVLQTVMDLIENTDCSVFVVSDGVSSSNKYEIPIVLQRMRNLGAVVTTSDSLLFEMCGDAQHANFKEISRIVKESLDNTEMHNLLLKSHSSL